MRALGLTSNSPGWRVPNVNGHPVNSLRPNLTPRLARTSAPEMNPIQTSLLAAATGFMVFVGLGTTGLRAAATGVP
jgi:hypothetical protein